MTLPTPAKTLRGAAMTDSSRRGADRGRATSCWRQRSELSSAVIFVRAPRCPHVPTYLSIRVRTSRVWIDGDSEDATAHPLEPQGAAMNSAQTSLYNCIPSFVAPWPTGALTSRADLRHTTATMASTDRERRRAILSDPKFTRRFGLSPGCAECRRPITNRPTYSRSKAVR
jgi:hypothetical protein